MRAHLSCACVSLGFFSSASFSSLLFWALAASSLARATVNLRALTSQAGDALAVLASAGAAGEAGGEGADAEEAALLISSVRFLIL